MFSLVLALALAAPSADLGSCSWDNPGRDPFTGDVPASVDRYTDIPPDVRARLKERMALLDYDDMVSVGRDSIEGGRHYDPAIRDMHFGAGRICHSVSRERWAPDHLERGLVYCESGQCILVPTVCRNVSRITALPLAAAPGAGPPGELAFAPPGAGAVGPPPPAAEATLPGMAEPTSFAPTDVATGPLIGPPIPIAVFPVIPGGVIPVSPPTVPPTLPVPEPETWALWLAGLAGIGWRLRARTVSCRVTSTTGA